MDYIDALKNNSEFTGVIFVSLDDVGFARVHDNRTFVVQCTYCIFCLLVSYLIEKIIIDALHISICLYGTDM